MALSAARRLSSSSSSSAGAAPKLSTVFTPRQKTKPHPPPPDPGDQPPAPKLSVLFSPRQTPKPRPRPPPEPLPRPRRPRQSPRQRRPWEEEAAALLGRLQEGRYLPGPDVSSGPRACSPDVVKAAAERFGNDNQVVSKWLSGSDLKKVALFGCPCVERRTVFASKRLRAFFNIKEDKVCSSCKLRSSCQFVNQEVRRHNKVILSDAMRIITLFVLDACPQELQVTDELKASVCKLLKDTINLSS